MTNSASANAFRQWPKASASRHRPAGRPATAASWVSYRNRVRSKSSTESLRASETVSNRTGELIWAAKGMTSRVGLSQLLVMTQEPDPILIPAFRWVLVAGGVTVVVAALVAVRLSRSLTNPLVATREVTSRIADGDLDARIDTATIGAADEVADVVESVNTMAENLLRSKSLERHFLMSVSHDLRTPLTSIKGYAEALSDGAVEDPARTGAVIESEASAERLVGDLLLLARLGSTDFPLDRRRVDLTGVVRPPRPAGHAGEQHVLLPELRRPRGPMSMPTVRPGRRQPGHQRPAFRRQRSW